MSAENFWTDAPDRHREIARTFYENIEVKHPDYVTSRGMCHCLEWTNFCGWATTSVEYPTYTGPRVVDI